MTKILSMNNILDLMKTPKDVNNDIVKRMRARRKEKKLTQVELSRLAGVSLGSLKRFEQTGNISLNSLIKIAFVLDCQEDFDLSLYTYAVTSAFSASLSTASVEPAISVFSASVTS
jgi:transcriptional regulator with XRE-family HTH domain